MEWQIFAISQMALLAIGLSTAFFLHARTYKKQNDELRTHLTALEASSSDEEAHPSPREWTKEHLASIPEDNPAHAIVKAVLKNALRSKDDFLDKLPEIIATAGFGGGEVSDTDAAARIAELEAQLEAVQAAGGAGPDDDQSAELKSLLQQFTNDSREMMACIQQLEAENAQLKRQLEGADEGTPPQEKSAEAVAADKPEEALASDAQATEEEPSEVEDIDQDTKEEPAEETAA